MIPPLAALNLFPLRLLISNAAVVIEIVWEGAAFSFFLLLLVWLEKIVLGSLGLCFGFGLRFRVGLWTLPTFLIEEFGVGRRGRVKVFPVPNRGSL